MLNTRLMNALQEVFEYMDVAPGDVYWSCDGVEFSLGRDWEVVVDDHYHPIDDANDGFCTVMVRRTNSVGQVIARELERMNKHDNVIALRDSLLDAIEACQRRIGGRLAKQSTPYEPF